MAGIRVPGAADRRAVCTVVAYKPHAVSREVIVILGMLQLVEAVLLFMLAGRAIAAILLTVAAFFILIGSMLWPKGCRPSQQCSRRSSRSRNRTDRSRFPRSAPCAPRHAARPAFTTSRDRPPRQHLFGIESAVCSFAIEGVIGRCLQRSLRHHRRARHHCAAYHHSTQFR